MNFLIDDELFLIYYKEIWDIVRNKFDRVIKKWLDSDPAYDIIVYIKTKMIYSDIKTDFDDKETPEEGFHYICLSMIFIDSILKKGDKYHPEVFLEECEYFIKKKKHRYINKEPEICSNGSDKE